MNRKGTEKPIEIFVALFIILAVALVMLKLFQGQIAEKQKELSDVQQEQKSQELKTKVQLACQQKCTEASNNQCSPASLASLCSYGSQNILGSNSFVDLNNDQKEDADTTLLAGIGVCESNVYCFHVIDSCCAREISAQTCKTILHDYWINKKAAADDAAVNALLLTNVPAGSCDVTDPANGGKAGTKRWDTLASWPTP